MFRTVFLWFTIPVQMQLIIDLGNTQVKLALFANDQLVHVHVADKLTLQVLKLIFDEYPCIESAILSNVAPYPSDVDEYLEQHTRYILLTHQTLLPFTVDYTTPDTLGKDRIAAVAGARAIYPEHPILVIDAGTCITYDIITHDNRYLGGGISPGIQMRYKALHTFTGGLPLLEGALDDQDELIGNSTSGSIHSGVKNGVLSEMEGLISNYQSRFDGLKVVMSGGDYKYFEKYIKNDIFATPNIVVQGLKKILDFNESN